MTKRIFTPDMLDTIRQWIADGIGRTEIAARLGCSVNSLQVTCCKHGVSLRRHPRKYKRANRSGRPCRVLLPPQVIDAFEDHSDNPAGLAARLLTVIAQDGLIDAVLDEESA